MTLAADLGRLNDQQRRIIEEFKGPALIIAGPGTGKTRTVSVLIGTLLASGSRMKEILALTFSDKAAAELRQRVLAYFPASFDECWISTFHSFCARVLREQFHLVGIHPEFKLLTGFKEALLLSDICRGLAPEDFPVFGRVLTRRGFQQEVLTFISLLKSNLVSPDDLAGALTPGSALPGSRGHGEPEFSPRLRQRFSELLELYRAYEKARQATGYLDFRDLIRLSIEVLRDPGTARAYQQKFRAFLVDEFQDTDPAQFLLLKLLCLGARRPRLGVIGDPRQSIYRFRGADPRMMSPRGPFGRQFRAKVFPLAVNYRCAEPILQAAGRLAWADRDAGGDEPLVGGRPGPGFVDILAADDEQAEARLIARRAATLLLYDPNRRHQPSDIAILVRNNYQIDHLTEALRALHLPFAIAGDMKFFRTEEVSTLVSLLQAAGTEGAAREEALRRAFSSPVFGFDPLWVQDLLTRLPTGAGLQERLDLWAVDPAAPDLPGDDDLRTRVVGFAATTQLLVSCRALPLDALFGRLVLALPPHSTDPTAPGAPSIYHLRSMIADFSEIFRRRNRREATLADLLPDFDEWLTYYGSTLEQATETAEAGIRLMTIHQAKGLEFPVVFVCGLADGVFPVQIRENLLVGSLGLRRLQERIDRHTRELPFFNPYPSDLNDHLEEERRLFYVAITRAEEGLILTWPRRLGTDPAMPAPFLKELNLGFGTSPRTESTDDPPLSLAELRIRLAALSDAERTRLQEELPTITAGGSLPPDILIPRSFRRPGIEPISLPTDFAFSAHALKAYLECPRRFFFTFVLRISDPVSRESLGRQFGSALHACFEHLHHPDSPWTLRPPTPEELKPLWDTHGAPLLAGWTTLECLEREETALAALERYRTAVYGAGQIPGLAPSEVERAFRFPLGDAICSGRIDRLVPDSSRAWIIDYKTTTSPVTGESLASRAFPSEPPIEEMQMPLYLLAARHLGFTEVTAVTLFVATDAYKKSFKGFKPGFLRAAALNLGFGPEWGVPVDEDQFSAFTTRVTELITTIRRERVFDCRPSERKDACTCRQPPGSRLFCEFRPFCQERLEELHVPLGQHEETP
jgi:superfamily I DNA/RNA helicase